ncbi:hypothetical protein Tco_1454785, partial [Tanacetum coccineum]
TAHGGIMYRIDKKIITQLSKGLALFCLLSRPSTSRIRWRDKLSYGTSRQDGVTAKLKTENPSLDTSIRKDGVTAKLKTENLSLDTSIRILYLNKVTNEAISPVTEKFQRLQTLIISSHKWLRCQAYRTKVYDVEIIIRTYFLPECNVTRFNAFV